MRKLVTASLALAALAGLAQAQTRFFLIEPDAGYDYAVVQDVSKDGRYALVSLQNSTQRPTPLFGYILDLKTNARTNITGPGNADLIPLAISNNRTVVGYYGGGALATSVSFIWTDATGLVDIGGLPGNNINYATGVSADGTIVVGTSGTSFGDAFQQGWRWTSENGFTPLDDIGNDTLTFGAAEDISADGTTVVGAGTIGDQDPDTDDVGFAVFWGNSGGAPTTIGNLPNPLFTGGAFATAASSDGSVIIGTSPAFSPSGAFTNRAFRYTAAGGMVNLGSLPASPEGSITALDCSNDGNTVVGYMISGGVNTWRAVVWTQSTGFRTLDQILAANGAPPLPNNIVLRETYCSGDGKTIGGWAYNTATQRYKGYIALPCNADFNRDDTVDFFDYLDFVAAFAAEGAGADFNGDSTIDFFDYLDFVAAFAINC